MEEITTDEGTFLIEYKSTKIGDLVFDKNSKTTYEASMHDADDLNWIVKTRISLKTK